MAVNGTEWVEPGTGATIRELRDSLQDKWGPVAADADGRLVELANEAFSRRTNLHLTGDPLTADDLKRIAEAR